MITDYHCHILPGIDDGSRNTEMSLEMIRMMRKQGVEKIVATPHFYAHRERSIERYLEKREMAFQKLLEADPTNAGILLGAEVAIEHGISQLDGIEKLSLGNSNYILLELPYGPFAPWLLEEIDVIALETGYTPVIAHINRYLDYYNKRELESVLQVRAVFQFNNEAFGTWGQRRFVKSLVKRGLPYVFGSDAHNITSRKPDWDVMRSKVAREILRGAEILL